ncbi:unnamed protein product [Allacma fusca]|uniref:G-protein coupled receptors family 1 profile domain-containing protein n=1 Tax=Allacma fusca TaxID=39272 RepID=A0A8J2JS18_9HEXA|nr:unnamed protein product [Allacma fusca]
MLAVVVLLFALCWLPLQSYNFLQSIFSAINEFQYINMVWFAMHLMAMSNSCCNPFIYAIYNDKFQREFRARLRCMNICQGHRRSDSPCSEQSDFDRSKIRISYRFHDKRVQQNGIESHPHHSNPPHLCNHSHNHGTGHKARRPHRTNHRTKYEATRMEPSDFDGISEISNTHGKTWKHKLHPPASPYGISESDLTTQLTPD